MNPHFLPLYLDIARLQSREVDAPNHFSVHNQKQAVTREKFRQVGIVVLALDNRIHRIAYGFQPLELLDLMNDGRLIHGELRGPSAQIA